MKRLRLHLLAAGLLCSGPGVHAVVAQPMGAPVEREPRERFYDVLHYQLTLDVDERAKSATGQAVITVVPLRPMFDRIQLDAAELNISRVQVDDEAHDFSLVHDSLLIPLIRVRGPQDTLEVTVTYSVKSPRKGLYFMGPDSSSPGKLWQVWSQGEPEENRFWFPCYDYPNDRATSEMIVTVRKPLMAVSNGTLLNVKDDATGQRRTFYWSQSKPHVSYLISLAVGEYVTLEDSWEGVPIVNYVYPSNREIAPLSFSKTPAMMEYFSNLTGVRYPWEKYGHVIVQDFIHSGQENITVSTLTDRTIHDHRAHLDETSDALVAHELAHQWYGNLVSFRDWSHAWLSEGFATYLQMLFQAHDLGPDELAYAIYEAQRDVIAADRGDLRRPTATNRFTNPSDLFDNRIYGKGACVLHMLRQIAGEELFWAGIRAYTERYSYQSVETSQLRLAFEESSGLNLGAFFNQWIYGAGYPEFEVKSRWVQASRSVFVSVKQVQKVDSLTPYFQTPVEIEVWVGGQAESYNEMITGPEHEVSFPAYQEPKLVIFDKGKRILGTVKYEQPAAAWIYQLRNSKNAIDRIAAIEELKWRVDLPEVREALVRTLIDDRFWAARREAAWALADVPVDSVDFLLPGYGDRDARVRAAVIAAMGNFRGPRVTSTLRYAFDSDSSYAVNAAALRSLAKADSVNALVYAYRGLERNSHKEVVRLAALNLLARLSDEDEVLETIRSYAEPGRPAELRVLAISLLVSKWNDDDDAMDFVVTLISDPSYQVRRAAVQHLGASGYRDALSPLTRRLVKEPDTRIQAAIRESIKNIETKKR